MRSSLSSRSRMRLGIVGWVVLRNTKSDWRVVETRSAISAKAVASGSGETSPRATAWQAAQTSRARVSPRAGEPISSAPAAGAASMRAMRARRMVGLRFGMTIAYPRATGLDRHQLRCAGLAARLCLLRRPACRSAERDPLAEPDPLVGQCPRRLRKGRGAAHRCNRGKVKSFGTRGGRNPHLGEKSVARDNEGHAHPARAMPGAGVALGAGDARPDGACPGRLEAAGFGGL